MLILPQNSPIDARLQPQLHAIRGRIATAARSAGRSEESITLVAVSKGHDAEVVRAGNRLGLEHFGESYLQEALPKIQNLQDTSLVWHFIGRLQANKTRPVAEHFAWVHGVDRLKIAERLSSQRAHYAPPLNVCIQVNVAHDQSKAGIAPGQTAELAIAVATLPRLRLRGLMCMLPAEMDLAARDTAFGALRELLVGLQPRLPDLDSLSMGMSGDFEAAIRAGATMVRIGTALFGARDQAES